ncbi:HDOD domain-containing protein [Sulfurimonas sp. SAG-AH-194-C20]|nr:HDOD domain-containing protein [Sulfurimonas sp. SAG-AH-194-C20]MDF1878579.1 HDOD domain-containing protein [Sulfurimonas sp. SAG-AH-194-C20]
MITRKTIENFIQKIPPAPKALKETLIHLNTGNLVKAATVAKEDKALSTYLKVLVNKPIYGFKNEVSEVSQIFGILGVERSLQAVYNYMMTLLSPSKWQLFKLNRIIFYNLQADLSVNWEKILKYLDIQDKDILSSISLLPASIIVSEALFCEKKADIDLLRSVNEIDLNTILQRLCGVDLFDICQQIAQKWEMPQSISDILQSASGLKASKDNEINILGKWMHLLLFYTLSQPKYIEAELNDFIDFQIDYVGDIYEEFSKVMEIS